MVASLQLLLNFGIEKSTADGSILKAHPAVVSYIADIPETKDMLGVIHGNRSSLNCRRCLVETNDVSSLSYAPRRNVIHKRKMIKT